MAVASSFRGILPRLRDIVTASPQTGGRRMAEKQEIERPVGETVLVAYVTVHLTSGDSFQLLPFQDDADVKSRVTDLLDDWVKSGYLVRGGHIHPWHQVKLVEATSVTELSRRDSEQDLTEWQISDLTHLQQAFWKTKHPRKSKKDGEQEKKNGNAT
jgi:hypothetical protein